MFNSSESKEFELTDLLDVISIILGYENLIENREQSAHNDVEKANDAQTKRLLIELDKKFDDLKLKLDEILDLLKKE